MALSASLAGFSPTNQIKDDQKTLQNSEGNSRDLQNQQQIILANHSFIQPQDPSRPCPFAKLSSELRSLIFEYSFSYSEIPLVKWTPNLVDEYNPLLWPALLRVSRVIRTEAARAFFAGTPFVAKIGGLDFSQVTGWIERLPSQHRKYLRRNSHLNLHIELDEILPSISSYRFAEENLTDQYLSDICHQFGNVDDISGTKDRQHFLHFCTLAKWWLWCGEPIHEDIQWRYEIWGSNIQAPVQYFTWRKMLWGLMESSLETPVQPIVEQNWTRSQEKMKMKKECLNMLNQVDMVFKNIEEIHSRSEEGISRFLRIGSVDRISSEEKVKWDEKVKAIKDYVERWGEQ